MADIIPTTGQLTFDYVRDFLLEHGGTSDSSINADASRMFTASMVKAVFAKFKPLFVPAGFDKYFPDRTKVVNGKYWWQSDNGFCGFNLTTAKANGFADLVRVYQNTDEMNGWVYDPPKGVTNGSGNPFRIDDFRGYNALAPNIVQGFYAPAEMSKMKTEYECQIMLPMGLDDCLDWLDFEVLKNYYFGVMLYQSANNLIRVTGTATLGSAISQSAEGGSVSAKLNPSNLAAGKYTAYPFICSKAYTQMEADSSHTIYALPNVQPMEVDVINGAVNLDFWPDFTYIYGTNEDEVRLMLTVKNSSSSTIAFNNNFATVKYKDGNEDSLTGSEKTVSLKNFSVGAGSTLVDLGSITKVGQDMRNNCYILMKLNNAQYTIRREPKADMGSIPKIINQ